MKLGEAIAIKTSTIVNNETFKETTRKMPAYFTRNRKMPFEDLIYFMIFHLKCSISSALRRYFKDKGVETTMTQQSLSEARKKVNVWAFKHLFIESAKTIAEYRSETWNGYNVYATDGTKIALPDAKNLLDHYGGIGKNADSPTAQASALYDMLNDNLVDASMEPLSTGERSLAEGHIRALQTFQPNGRKLIIYDRGYSSFDFVKLHFDEGLFFLMRVKSKFSTDIDAQAESDGRVCLQKNGERICVRVIKFPLSSGETEMLITNIEDKHLGENDFKKLYFMRWPIETKYGAIKEKLQVENFSSLTVEGVQQDFFATMYMVNLVAGVAFDAQAEIEEERADKENKHDYKANRNELIGILKDNFVAVVLEPCPLKQAEMMKDILNQVKRHVIPIRPDRTVARNKNPRAVRFHHNKKLNC